MIDSKEARIKSLEVQKTLSEEEFVEIEKMICDSIEKGNTLIKYRKILTQENHQKLTDLGYSVEKTISIHDGPITIISW